MDMLQIIISSIAIFVAIVYPLFVLLGKNRTVADYTLFVALTSAAAIELFDLLALCYNGDLLFWKRMSIYAEGCLPAAWLLFTLTYAREKGLRATSPVQRLTLAISLVFVAIPLYLPENSLFYSPDLIQERMLFLNDAGFVFYLALLVYLIMALINLEITFANASRAARWNIKFEMMGAGSVLAALIFYYSQSILYRTINMNLMPVRTVALMLAVFLIAYSHFRENTETRIHVSRHIVFKSVVLFAVGVYLIGLGLIGEGLRYFGETFQRSIIIALVFAAGIGLLVVLLSEKVKRKTRVFLIKNFYQDKYDYKTQWVQFTDRMATSRSSDELLTGILSCYCETFGMGGGALYLGVNEPGRFSLASHLEFDYAPTGFIRQDPLLTFMQESTWVINIRDNACEASLVGSEFGRISDLSLVIPLFLNDQMDGFILLGRALSKNESYNFEDYDLMKTFARQTSSALLNLRLSVQLAEAREMEVLGRISTFVIHDLKNLVYTLSLIVDNAGDYITDPEFQQDMLASLGNTVTRMNTLIGKLKYLPEKRGLQKAPADLLRLSRETAKMINGAEVRVTGDPVMSLVDSDEMQKVVLNLLLNAVEATEGNKPVTVEVGCSGKAFIRVLDEGCGISEEFMRFHLFGPFKTTKKNGLGIGLYQCRNIVEAHDGKIDVTSEPGKGSVFTVWLPAGLTPAGEA